MTKEKLQLSNEGEAFISAISTCMGVHGVHKTLDALAEVISEALTDMGTTKTFECKSGYLVYFNKDSLNIYKDGK